MTRHHPDMPRHMDQQGSTSRLLLNQLGEALEDGAPLLLLKNRAWGQPRGTENKKTKTKVCDSAGRMIYAYKLIYCIYI